MTTIQYSEINRAIQEYHWQKYQLTELARAHRGCAVWLAKAEGASPFILVYPPNFIMPAADTPQGNSRAAIGLIMPYWCYRLALAREVVRIATPERLAEFALTEMPAP